MCWIEILIITLGVIIITAIISWTAFCIQRLRFCVKHREHMLKSHYAEQLNKECKCFKCLKPKREN